MPEPHQVCDAECPKCGLHVGDPGGPEAMGPTPEGEIRMRSLEDSGGSGPISVEFIMYCGACRIPWLGSLEVAVG
jgi:hypothetical protein